MSPVRLLAADRGPPRKLIAFLSIIALAVMPLVGYLIWSGYQEAMRDAETKTRNYAAILEARLEATLRRADATLLATARTIPVAALSKQTVPRYAREMNADLDHRLFNFKEIASFLVADRYGDVLYHSVSARTPNVNVSDRSYFRQLRETPQVGPVFSEVITVRILKRPVLVMASALTDGRGNFLGVVLATLELEHFQTLFQSLAIGPQGVIALRRTDDQRLVLRWPHLANEVNKPLNPQNPTAKRLAAGERAATVQLTAQTDGVQRIFSYQMLERYPFYVSVAVSRDNVLAEWRTRSLTIGALSLLLLGLLAWLLFRLWGALVREDQVTGALKESERFARASLDALSSHIAVLDADGRILATNRRWQEFAEQNGQPPERVSVGADYLGVCQQAGVMGDEAATTAATLIRDLISGRRTEGSFEYACHSSHEERWFVCRSTRFSGDRPVRVVMSHENVTARKQAEAEVLKLNAELEQRVAARTAELAQTSDGLRDSAARIEAIVETVVDGIITIDERGIVETINPAAERIFGYAAAEVIGQNVKMLMPEPYYSQHDGYLEHYRATGEARIIGIGREVVGRRKDSSTFPLELAVSEMWISGQRCFTGSVRDITERKQAEQALVAARDAAELANRAKDSFLATTSHEIRTPLGGLMGMLELLGVTPLNDEQRETLLAARDSGRSLLRILDDLLDWSKIEEGRLELSPQPTSIATLVAEVVNTYARVASARSLVLEQQVDARLSPVLIVDPLRLSQVLNNFVSNALKFTHAGGVEVRAELLGRREGAEQVRFSVRDTGIGIEKEAQQRLFQNYGQGSAETARMYGGTGLGLAICRRLADLLDGRIEVESAPGRGSTFSITLSLPVSAAAVEDVQRARGADAAASVLPLVHAGAQAEAPLVLVVDDHPVNRRLLAQQLGLLGLRAETAENGETALPLWRDGRFALVITDCHMPVMDGYALARAIRRIEAEEARPRTPIIAWTANALAEEKDHCSAAGMDELLVKPAELTQLREVLSKWLGAGATMALGPVDAGHDASGGTAPIDLAALDQIAANAADRMEILRDFLAQTRSDLAELEAALKTGDLPASARLAHRMKGACRMVGARELEAACEALQGAARQGNPEDARVAKAALDRAMARLDAHLAQAAGANEEEE